ncbi:hypothetical protein [Siphonobacter curvatus]|uniref:Uncharacterized protein n=1 Tax=Siphonobacter curvatus TaxID=2094562 RepID=A0A2S7IPX0_9BACT|nr:hypothetical protein [Siphonobacter curvatus]PQA59709.1 hypothetical protein C5O19_08775 [Siphonobacter curvatus]
MAFLQTAWGDQADIISMDEINQAIAQLQDMDEEHGAFWVGDDEEDYVLEIHRDLKVMVKFPEDPDEENWGQLSRWEDIRTLYAHLLS